MSNRLMYTIQFRRIRSGFKEASILTDDLNHGVQMAQILIRSPAYAHCYAVVTDWQGNVISQISNAPPPQQYQQPYYPPQQYYRPPLPPMPIIQPQVRQLPQHHRPVVNAQFEEG